MSDDENRYEGIPAHTDDYYEAIAMQEEIYLEEVEENLRAILASYKPSASRGGATNQRAAESLSQQLDRAAEELITGDSDDAPLSEETVAEVLRITLHVRRSDGYAR